MDGISAIIFDWGRTLYDNETKSLFPETRAILHHCKQHYVLGIVSIAADESKVTERLRILEEEQLRPYFSIALFHTEGKHLLLENVLAHLRVQPTGALVVDDRMLRLADAIHMGCKTIWIQRGKFSHELPDAATGEPTYRVQSLKEIVQYL